jgi:succinyl-CoA synthetase alpha subunit
MIAGTVEQARSLYPEGSVGVMSRSGSGVQAVPYYLRKSGVGMSTVIGLGGDAFPGSTFIDLLPLFQEDPETKVVVGFGEIGGSIEEQTAEYLASKKFTKPFVIYIAGRHAPQNVRLGHAGAMVEGGRGGAQRKIEVLRESGAIVVERIPDIGPAVAELLRGMN